MHRLLDAILQRIVKVGDLTFIDGSGQPHHYGDRSGIPVVVRATERAVERRLILDPQLALGEAYMRGQLIMEQGQLYDFLELVLRNAQHHPPPRWTATVDAARYLVRRLKQFNPSRRARRNVAHHYDIDGTIYDLFLDRDRQYSCAYFEEGVTDLDEAQHAKKRHLAAKMALVPGQRVLDIGSGWGGLGLDPAQSAG